MAKRRRSRSGRAQKPQRSKRTERATRPAARQAYPSPAERERIIERRDELFEKLISVLMFSAADQGDRSLVDLMMTYGPDEVNLVLEKFYEMTRRQELIGEEAFAYRAYRRTFTRFGGERSFLGKPEYIDLVSEHGMLVGKRKFKSRLPFMARRSQRERTLFELLLLGAGHWEDITPPAPPPRPAEFAAPVVGAYDYPARTLLKWGWAENEDRLLANAKNTAKWSGAMAELAQMVLDAGLLEGWPGEAASWAPLHALDLLGKFKAADCAGRLLTLLGRENDWLSDRLPLIWGQMGPAAAAPLWAYLADRQYPPKQRALAARGLSRIAERNPAQRLAIVEQLADLLRQAPADDAVANAYIVYVLHLLEAVEAKAAIQEAFAQDKVDPKIIQPPDVGFLAAG